MYPTVQRAKSYFQAAFGIEFESNVAVMQDQGVFSFQLTPREYLQAKDKLSAALGEARVSYDRGSRIFEWYADETKKHEVSVLNYNGSYLTINLTDYNIPFRR